MLQKQKQDNEENMHRTDDSSSSDTNSVQSKCRRTLVPSADSPPPSTSPRSSGTKKPYFLRPQSCETQNDEEANIRNNENGLNEDETDASARSYDVEEEEEYIANPRQHRHLSTKDAEEIRNRQHKIQVTQKDLLELALAQKMETVKRQSSTSSVSSSNEKQRRKRKNTRISRLTSIRASITSSASVASRRSSDESIASTSSFMANESTDKVAIVMGNADDEDLNYSSNRRMDNNDDEENQENERGQQQRPVLHCTRSLASTDHLTNPSASADQDDGDDFEESSFAEKYIEDQQHIVWAVFTLIKNRSWKKKLVTAIVVTLVILTIVDLIWFNHVKNFFTMFLEWMKDHLIAGTFACMGMFVLATIIFIPPTLLTLGSGFIFAEAYGLGMGIYLATISCFIGCCLGAIFSFVRARYMMRDLIKLFARRYPMIRKFDTALKEKGFRVMLLLRLSSIVPFNALNYIGGVTGVKLSSFIASLIGLVPQILFTVFVGATAGDIQQGHLQGEQEIMRDVMLAAGVACAILALLSIWKLAKMELHENEDAYTDLDKTLSDRADKDGLSDKTLSIDEGEEEDSEEWFWVWT